ncbi:unnamed protein product, partial [Rotaria socialis]
DVRVDNLCARRLVQVEQIESQKELRGGIDRNLFPFPFQLGYLLYEHGFF